MLISLKDYALKHGRSSDTVRRLAEQGKLLTAKKIGRNWAVEDSEPYPSSQAKWTVASLFSGCGGLDLGFIGGFTFLGKECSFCWNIKMRFRKKIIRHGSTMQKR